MVESYRELRVWKMGIELVECCYKETRSFPKEEMFGLTSQIRRAAVSVPANIAEGYGRDSTRDYIRFLRQAQGSLKELETHLILSERLGFMNKERSLSLLQTAQDIGKMIRSLYRKLQSRLSA